MKNIKKYRNTNEQIYTRIQMMKHMLAGNPGGGGALPYMGYIGMCRCEGYGFQAVYSRIGYINQSVWA